MMIKPIIFLCLILSSFFLYSLGNAEQRVTTGFRSLGEIQNNIELKLENLSGGSYYIEILLKEHSFELLNTEHSELITLVIVLESDQITSSKEITILLDEGSLGRHQLLFKCPEDFKRRSDVRINIKEIRHDETLLQYYETLRITVRKYSRFLR